MMRMLIAGVAGAVLSVCAQGAEVTLAWDPPIPADLVEGYRVYVGPRSREYDVSRGVGTNLVWTVRNCDPATTYFFAVTATNQWEESEYSRELVWDNVGPTGVVARTAMTNYTTEAMGPVPDWSPHLALSDDVTPTNLITWWQDPEAGKLVLPGTNTVMLWAHDTATNWWMRKVRFVLKEAPRPGRPATVTGRDERGVALQFFPVGD